MTYFTRKKKAQKLTVLYMKNAPNMIMRRSTGLAARTT
jgi:hypothetical protein